MIAVSDAGRRARLAPEDLFELRYIRDGQLSADGRHLAYVVSSTDDQNESFGIFIAKADGSDSRRLKYSGNASAPRWSPDGQWLAFVLDGRLQVAAAESLENAQTLTPSEVTVQGAPCWSPDSTQLMVSLQRHVKIEGPRRIVSNHFRSEGLGFIDGFSQRIAVVNHASRALQWVTEDTDGFCSQPEWSPCGRRILFMASDSAVPFSSYSPRLMILELEKGSKGAVLGENWFVAAARWLPDGEHIAVAAVADSTLTAPNPVLWVVDLQGRVQLRTPQLTGKISGLIHHDMPAWDLMQANPLVIVDGQTACVTVLNRGSMEIFRVSLSGTIAVERILTGERSCIALYAHPSTDRLLYAVSTLHSPTELWSSTLSGGEEKPLTDLNGAVLAQWPAMRVEQFVSTSDDGVQSDVWFMAQADNQGPLPTVLFVHGGPFASTGHAFRYDFLLLAANGFGVVFGNFRGSAGYGDAFTRAIMGDWGGRGFPDHMGTVDAAVARGLADPTRLGVWGPSHGGFATCWIVGHTARFKAAVAESASTSFFTSYYLKDGPEVIARDLGGRPHEIPDVYRACSALTYAHRCTTPTLFIHGEDDLRCPIGEAEQFFRVLLDVGCKAELFRIPNCDHLGDSCGPLSARRAQNEALLDWFEQHL